MSLESSPVNRWNSVYGQDEYAYGTEPNGFLKHNIDALEPGQILLPADGEGRNSVYAAGLGWQVDAYDFSPVAQAKATALAKVKEVEVNFVVTAHEHQIFPESQYDVVALIFCHTHPNQRLALHQNSVKHLKPGGLLLLEAYSKEQIQFDSGGPKNVDWLYDIQTLQNDFEVLEIQTCNKMLRNITEGTMHTGMASVIQLIARKPK